MKNNLNKILILFFTTLSLSFAVDNYALDISSDGHVDIGNLSNYINNGQQFSVSFWSKVNSEQEMRISDRAGCDGGPCHRGFEFLIGAWGVSFRLIDTWSNNMLIVRETSSFGDNNWHHVAATYNGSSDPSGVNIYIDGEPYGVSTHYNSLSGSSMNDLPLRIGGNGEDSGGAGIVDEVSLWLRTISQEEIQQMMVNGLNGDEQDLLSYWNFNEGEGSELNDISSNGFNGNIVNSVWTTDAAPLGFYEEENDENYSVHFDFMSGYSESLTSATNIFGGIQPFTVEAWYKNEGVNTGANSGYDDGANIVSSYRRSGGGDPDGNFNFGINPGDSEISGKGFADYGVITNERMDDGAWHHLAATYEPNADGSWSFRLYLDGVLNDQNTSPSEGYDHTSSNNNIRMNNHSPFAGDHMLDCSYAGMSITNGAKYTENFSPQFPLISDGNTIVNLDFSQGGGNQLIDNSGNGNHFNLYGNYQWGSDVPTEPVYGCTDSYAGNYDENANSDDGSCTDYPDNGDYSLKFTGDDIVKVPTNNDLPFSNSSRTMTARFKVDDLSEQGIISYGTPGDFLSFGITIHQGKFCASGWSSDLLTDISPEIDRWYNVVYTYNENGTRKLYIDGNLLAQDNTNLNTGWNNYIFIGDWTNETMPLKGNIFDISIWNSVLNNDEINYYLTNPVPVNHENLVAYWKLSSGEGDIIFDHSGSLNHGTINGAAWSDDVPTILSSTVEVTFNVNMNDIEVSEDGVSMVGVFGSPGDSPMSDDDGDGVWTRTVELEKNSSFSYKFVSCLSWDCLEDLSGQSCATGEWSDRYLETGEQDTTINASFGICEPHYSLEFNGTDNYVISTNEIPLNGSATKSLFARFKFNDQPEGVQYVAGWGWDGEGPQPGNKNFSIASSPLNHPDLYSSNNNLMMWGVGAPNITDIQFNYFLNPGEWCDALITHDGSELKIYVNGQLTNSVAYTSNVNTSNLLLGKKIGYYDDRQWFNGNIDQVLVYDRVISPDEAENFYETKIHPTSGLILSYNTDEGSGSTLLDESNNLNHGIISGALYSFDIPAPQIAGCTDPYANNYDSDANVDNGTCSGYPEDGSYSLEFDGQDDYLSIPDGDHLNIEGDYTWVISGKMNNVNLSQNLFSNNTFYNTDGYYINYLDWDNSVWFSLCSNGTCYQYNSLPNQIIENEWFNLVITKNNGLIQIYIDGQNVTADSWNITQGDDITQYYVDPNSELRIGIDGDDVQPFFGNLDEILLIKEALSEQEISDYMSSGIMNSDIDIVGNWKLNESSGSTAFDFSGKRNHASLNGPARSQDVPSLSEPYVTVTFNVDMDGVEVSEDGVSMVGVFGTPGDSPMSDDDGDGVWTRTVELEKNSSFSYKFVSCLSWDCMEDLSGQSCASGEWSDRYLETGEQDTTVNAVFGSCESNISSTTNYALNFDGQDDYVDINYNANLALNNEMTISGWVKIPSDHNSLWGSVVGGHNGYGYILYAGSNSGSSNGNLWLEVRDGGSVSGTTDLRDNNWHHIAVTYDGNMARAFVDGQLEGESSFQTGFQGTSGHPLKFGYVNHNVGNNEHFPGILDELSIYNIALDQSQIQFNMNNELSGLEEGLVGYWNFNSGDGDVLNDQSGNGNNGQINGATWTDDAPLLENDSDYAVGSLGPAGGFIIYDKGLVSDGWRYIEIAPDGWSGNGDPTTTWGCSGSEINGADGYAVGSGLQNSIDIANGCDGDNAASISLNTEINGYSDWHLPSIDELWLMYQLSISNNIGYYENHYYWSSTEFSSIGALFINFGSSEVQYQNIGETNKQSFSEHFRPIRYFSGEEQNENEAVTFTKQDYADPSMAENQDRITGDVWITRGTNQPLYNAALESGYQDESISPEGTVWAPGQTAFQVSTDNYRAFKQATGGNHENLPGRVMSMHIVGTELFYDVEFHSWTSDGNGGGFSYTRTPAELNSYDYPEGTVHFHKEDYADWELIQNQDRITEDTWITRANSNGIFNASSEESYSFNYDDRQEIGPSNTLWAYGVTGDVQGEYRPFKEAVQNQMSMSNLDEGGHTFSMHIVSENLFYDVEFHSWTCCGDGGGFSYTRTDQNGESVTFTKEDYANHTLEENQDRITDGVWITRGNDHPLFNIAAEANYEAATLYTNAVGSPENTEWAFGRTEDLNPNSYQPWQAAIGGTNPRGALGRFMSLHVISEDLYFDVVFTSWTCCGNGGGFSYSRMPASQDSGPALNGKLVGVIESDLDNLPLEGAHVIAVAEDESYSGEAFSDENGGYSIDLIGSLNYFVSISYEGLIDHNQYIYVAPFEDTYINVSLGGLEDAMVEGTVTDWYSNAPLANASVLLAYTDEEMITIESTTDDNGYFMVQVPGEEDYDLFVYADGYWVEHDAFYLSSGEHQVLSVGIAEMSSASRLYGTIRDFDTDELIPYAEVQLNCEQASDWDHTGEIGTYRVFSYYPDDCNDGVLIVAADGYETSVQSVGSIEFEAGSSYDLDIALVQGNDPDPGMLSGTVYSNIDGNVVGGANVTAYNVNTTQLFSVETLDDGLYQLFLPESEYYMSVTADNHEEYLDTLSITSGQSFTQDFSLDEMYLNTVSGVITDLSGNGLFDMEVYVIPAGESYAINSTFSNENGEYSLQVPNGLYDFGAGSNGYFMNFEYGVELSGIDQVIDFTLTPVSEFDGGIAGIVHLNEGDNSTVWINVWNSALTYQAYISPDENGAYTLPLVNGEYSMYAWVPGSDYQPVFIPGAFTIEDNVINYDIYFVAPDNPEAPTIVLLEDVPNDQGGQLELAWTPGEPMEYEIFPQYSVWRMEDGWNLIATVPYHGFDLYNMIVPTQGDSTADGIFESTFMVTAHTLDQNTFFDSDPLTGYSVDNIFPGIPQQLVATFQGESVDLEWNISEAEDLSHYNVYRQNQSLVESALVFVAENNFYSDHVGIDGDFQYWVTAVDLSGNESDASEPAMVTLGIVEEVLPLEFALLQNYPNPFNPSTQIMYTLPKTSSVKIVIYDMLGLKVRTLFSGSQDAGYKNVLWNATNDQGDPVSAGMYIYTIEAESFFASKKMILLK